MLDRVARLPGAPCLLSGGTRLGVVAFYHVNGSCQPICRTKRQSIWRDQCNRRVSGREQARARAGSWKFCLLCLVAAQKIAHAAHSLSRLGELHVKAGYVSALLAGGLARLVGATSLHVNRPLVRASKNCNVLTHWATGFQNFFPQCPTSGTSFWIGDDHQSKGCWNPKNNALIILGGLKVKKK